MSCNSSTSQISKPEPYSPFSWADPNNQYSGCPNSSMSGPKATGYWDFSHTTVHGFNTKPTIFSLSTRGLEMCTEILGSESGSNFDPSLDIWSYTTQQSSHIKTRESGKKTKHTTSSFPPPLTSTTSVKVQAHRGGGRLVITVVASSSSSSSACTIYLKSERENGRLRVFLHKDYYCRRRDQQLAENTKESGRKIRRSYKCGDESGNKKLTSLQLRVAFT